MSATMNELRTGRPLSCGSFEAIDFYQRGVDHILGSQGGAAELLDQALAQAPDFAPAAVARYMVAADARDPNANRFRAQAETAAALESATSWERDHVAVLLALRDRPGAAVQAARAHVAATPGDLLVISQLAGYLFFYGGPDKRRAVLELLESVQAAYDPRDSAYLSRLGFAASELGDRRRGREVLERALEARPEALYTIHGMAHVLHDDGDVEESARLLQEWLGTHGEGARGGQMYGHVHWHLALKEWQLGEEKAAWGRYQSQSAPETTSCGPVLSLADAGGFLLRRFLVQGEVAQLSPGTAELVDAVWGMIGHPFVALHVASLYLTAGDQAGLERCRVAVAASAPGAYRELASSLVDAVTHFGAGRREQAHSVLTSISADDRVGVGGSNVERELIELLEVASATAPPSES